MRDDLRKDLLVILTAACLGSLFGVIHNSIDVGISPEFYRLVKQAPASIAVGLWAAYIGLSRGFVPGLLLGAGFCFASDSGNAPPVGYRGLVPWMLVPILFAAAFSILAAMLPVSQVTDKSKLTAQHIEQVRRMHTGLYMGGFLGGAVACRGILRRRSGRSWVDSPGK